MNTIFTILTTLIVIASVLLVLVVLLQNSKGGGLASNFVAGNRAFGVRQTADMLEKVTWGLVSFILTVSVVTAFTLRGSNAGTDITTEIEKAATEQPAFPSAPVQQEDPTVQTTDNQAAEQSETGTSEE